MAESKTAQTTNRPAFAQLAFCQGCCCGRTDRNRPELPVEKLKAAWKAEKLNRFVQLTISGCLGPCERANVTLVMTAAGNTWLGPLAGDADYEQLTAWVRECAAAGRPVPLPAALVGREFERFPSPPSVEHLSPQTPPMPENSHARGQ